MRFLVADAFSHSIGVTVGWLGHGPLWSRKRPLGTAADTSGMCHRSG
jgi:hypothetical protein